MTPDAIASSASPLAGTTTTTMKTTNLIDASPILDIAFLHAIATHRPLGPHKHFNAVPVMRALERAAVRERDVLLANRSRRGQGDNDDDESSLSEEDEDGEEGGGEDDGGRSGRTRSRVKKESPDDDEEQQQAGELDVLARDNEVKLVDRQAMWARMEQLYDMAGLEELVSCLLLGTGTGTHLAADGCAQNPGIDCSRGRNEEPVQAHSPAPRHAPRRLAPPFAQLHLCLSIGRQWPHGVVVVVIVNDGCDARTDVQKGQPGIGRKCRRALARFVWFW